MAFCGKCGTENPDGNKFCAACGAELVTVQTPQQARQANMDEVKQSYTQSQAYAQQPVQNEPIKTEERKRSFVWTIVAVAAIVMAGASWFVDGIPLTIFLVVSALVLSILSLVKRARFRVISIIAVIISGLLSVLWIIQGIIDFTGKGSYAEKTVEIGNIQYTIPGYFQEPDDEGGDMLVYAFETSKDQGGFIDFIYRNMYDDDGETATAIASHQALLQTNQTQVDAAVDRMLFDAIEAGLDNINGQDEAFVKEIQIAGFPGKEFRFTVNQDGMDLNGLLVASFDIHTGDMYCVVMCETVDSTENKIADFDKIVESAKLMGGPAETSVTSFGGGEKNGADPSQKPGLSSTTGVDPELKTALDEYESFMNDYCDFMKKYAENPANAISMLSDYTEMLNRYTEFASKIDNLDTSNMSTADYEYYLDVLNRVEKKLLQVTQ